MKKQFTSTVIILLVASFFSFILFNQIINERKKHSRTSNKWEGELEYLETSGPSELAKQEYLMTRDPRTGKVPYHLLFEEYERVRDIPNVDPSEISWEERGPNNVGGRTRAIMWDPNDPTHQKLWAGSVSGGLWYKNNMANQEDEWNKVDDFWDILSTRCD